MKLARVAVLLLLAACEVPPLTLRFSLTDGTSQQCIGDTGVETTSCSDITMACRAWLSIRIVPPSDPEVPFASTCEPLSPEGMPPKDLCSIAKIDVPQPSKPIPEQVLEVQMAVFPDDAITYDDQGNPVCPIVEFGADGLPITFTDCSDPTASQCTSRVAVGGRAFYHPGDTETLVKLGCTELEQLRGAMCTGEDRTKVIATVNEFESQTSVDLATANNLLVAVGEPIPGAIGNYTLDLSRTHQLERVMMASLPSWDGEFVDLDLVTTYCIQVLDFASPAAPTLTCRTLPPDRSRLDTTAMRLKPDLLATVLKALYGPTAPFPGKGLVVGIVLNGMFAPQDGVSVMCQSLTGACTIKYLSADKLSFTTGGGTSTNGIWVSEDAPYGTTFSRAGQIVPTFGGLVDNKVTTVVLQDPTVGGQ